MAAGLLMVVSVLGLFMFCAESRGGGGGGKESSEFSLSAAGRRWRCNLCVMLVRMVSCCSERDGFMLFSDNKLR